MQEIYKHVQLHWLFLRTCSTPTFVPGLFAGHQVTVALLPSKTLGGYR
jgi:hypothetical protein